MFAIETRLTRLAAAALLVLSGCAVGPDFKPPAAPLALGTGYTAAPLAAQTASAPGLGGGAQTLRFGQDIPAQWWDLFRSDALDRLIRAALANNPDLAAAQQALRQAEESVNAQAGATRYPNVGLQAGAQRNQAAQLASPAHAPLTLYHASVEVSYTLDAFGANRRELESLAATVDYRRFQLEATYQTLVSNVVTTAIHEAALSEQLDATQQVLALQEKQGAVVEAQAAAGAVARSVLLQQRTQIVQTRALLPPLEKSLAFARHQLAVYAGQLPSEAGLPAFRLDSLHLPDELPVTLPSSLLRQRPDIRASEALLHAASAQVGVATANLYPNFTLSANLGSEALRAGGLFGAGGALWGLAAGVTQPIFDGGALRAKERGAEDAYAQAQAQYRGVVLGAFQNVADALRAVEFDATTLRGLAEAEALAGESLALSTRQYQLGAISYLSLLDVQRTYQQARLGLVQAQAARFADSAALFTALGGGWWNAPAAGAAAPAIAQTP